MLLCWGGAMRGTLKSRTMFLVCAVVLAVATRSPAQEPTREQLTAFRAAKTICLLVEESYGATAVNAGRVVGVELPFLRETRQLLRFTSLQEVQAPQACGLTLRIRAKGTADGARYGAIPQAPGGEYLFTGAALSGSIALEPSGQAPYAKSFEGKVPVPEQTTSRATTPDRAPFLEAYRAPGSFRSALAELVLEAFGEELLLAAAVEQFIQMGRPALEALLAHKSPRLFDTMVATLQNSDGAMRARAAGALGELGDARAGKPLVRALQDPEDFVRKAAAQALGKLATPEAVPALIGALEDKNINVRWAAAEGLGNLGDPRAVEPLIAGLRRGAVAVGKRGIVVVPGSTAIFEALKKITGQELRTAEQWEQWWERNKATFNKPR